MSDIHKESEEKEDLLRRCRSAEERIRNLQFELGNLNMYQRETQKLNAENAILRGRVDKLIQENNQKNQQIDDLFRKWEGSSVPLSVREKYEYMSKIDSYENRIVDLETRLHRLGSELVQKNQTIVDLRMGLQEKTALSDSLPKEVQQLKSENSEMKADLDRMYSGEFARSQKELREHEAAFYNNRFNSMTEEFAKSREMLENQVSQLEELSKRRDTEIEKLRIKLEYLRTSSESERKRLLTDLRTSESLSQDKDAQVQKFNQYLKSIQAEYERERLRLEEQVAQSGILMQSKDTEVQSLKHQFVLERMETGKNIKKYKAEAARYEDLSQRKDIEIQKQSELMSTLKESFETGKERADRLEVLMQESEGRIRRKDFEIHKQSKLLEQLKEGFENEKVRADRLEVLMQESEDRIRVSYQRMDTLNQKLVATTRELKRLRTEFKSLSEKAVKRTEPVPTPSTFRRIEIRKPLPRTPVQPKAPPPPSPELETTENMTPRDQMESWTAEPPGLPRLPERKVREPIEEDEAKEQAPVETPPAKEEMKPAKPDFEPVQNKFVLPEEDTGESQIPPMPVPESFNIPKDVEPVPEEPVQISPVAEEGLSAEPRAESLQIGSEIDAGEIESVQLSPLSEGEGPSELKSESLSIGGELQAGDVESVQISPDAEEDKPAELRGESLSIGGELKIGELESVQFSPESEGEKPAGLMGESIGTGGGLDFGEAESVPFTPAKEEEEPSVKMELVQEEEEPSVGKMDLVQEEKGMPEAVEKTILPLEPVQERVKSPEGPQRILIAESNEENLRMMSDALAKDGYEVLSAQSGSEILEVSKTKSPCLIIMNIAIGNMDGYAASIELAKDPMTNAIPMIMIISNPVSKQIFLQEKHGTVKSFLRKPFSLKELRASVRYVMLSDKIS